MQIKHSNRTRTIANAAISAILSWLMVFNGLPMQAIADEIMDDGQGAAVEVLDEEAAPEGEGDAADQAGDQEQEPASDDDADDGSAAYPEPELDPEPEPATSDDDASDESLGGVSFVTAGEDDEVEAVVVQGEAALSEEAAVEALAELDDLTSDEAAEVGGRLFLMDGDDPADDEDEPDDDTLPRSADGSYIDSISARWVTKDTVDNDDPNLLYIRPNGDNDQSVRLQVNYSLSGEHNYEPGDVVITIPAYIFKDRNGNDYGTMVIPYPEDPSTKNDFNWKLVTDEDGNLVYQITNTKRMSAATMGYIQFGIYDLTPHALVDMQESEPFTAKIEVVTYMGNLIGLDTLAEEGSKPLTAQFDTQAQVTAANKRHGTTVDVVDRSAVQGTIPEEFAGETQFVRVYWYGWGYRNANTYYTMDVEDTMSTTVEVVGQDGTTSTMDVLGFISTSSGGTVSSDRQSVSYDNAYHGYGSRDTSYYSYYTYYPFNMNGFEPDTSYTFHNKITFTITEDDPEVESPVNPNVNGGAPDPKLVTTQTATNQVTWKYSLPEWQDPYGHFMVVKNGNDDKYQGSTQKYNYTHNRNYRYTMSDTHRWSSSYPNGDFGIYHSALNELQDIANGTALEGKTGVRLSYTINSVGYVMPWMFDATTFQGEDGERASRISSNYTRPVTIETIDTGVSIGRNTEKLTLGEDYDLVSIEFPADPWVYTGVPHNINPDGSWVALTAGDGTFLYTRDNTKANWPDIELEVMLDGEWQHWATASWKSGSFVATLASGGTQSSRVIELPEGAENFRTSVTLQNTHTDSDNNPDNTATQAAIDYDVRVVINLRATDALVELIDAEFEKTYLPELSIYNSTNMTALRADTDDEIVSIEKDGYDIVRGYTTDTMAVPSKNSAWSRTKDVDWETNTITIHYSAKVEERSFISDRATYEEAIETGRLQPMTHGFWYDLLPKGATPDINSIKVRSGDTVVDVDVIDNYGDTGRKLLVVEVELTPVPTEYVLDPSQEDVKYYEDAPTISFDATVELTDLMDYYGENNGDDEWTYDRLHNVIAFESSNEHLGTIENYTGEPDDPYAGNNVSTKNPDTFESTDEKSALIDLDPNRDDPCFVYAGTYTKIDLESRARTDLRKDVQVNNDGLWSNGLFGKDADGNAYVDADDANAREQELQDGGDKRTVYEGGIYSYRLRVQSAEGTTTKGMVFYDSLENFYAAEGNEAIDIDAPRWQGTFTGVDVSQLVDAGCAPVVYYSTVENLSLYDESQPDGLVHENSIYETEGNVWVLASEYTGDLEDVKAIAVDASKRADGTDFELAEYETAVVIIKMRAPFGVENLDAHAYNNVELYATTIDDSTGSSVTAVIHEEYTKVAIKSYSLPVTKVWADDDDRDGLRPDMVIVRLSANGEDTGMSLPLDADNGWTGTFDNIPYTDPNGKRIRYTIREDEVGSYTVSLAGNADDGYVVTNTHEPERTQVPVTKTWTGDSPENRPAYVTYVLRGSDGSIKRQVVRPNASGSWNYTFTNLFKYTDHGQPIEYTVEEVLPTGDSHSASYGTPIIEGDNNGYAVDNPYHPYGDLKVSKAIENVTPASAAIEFEITLQFVTIDASGESVPIEGRYDYDILDAEGEVLSSGTVASDESITIKGGQTIHVKELPEYVQYRVTEGDEQGFALTSSSKLTGAIVPNSTVSASLTNTYSASGRFQASANKTLENRKLNQYQFRFELKDEQGNVVRTATSGRPTITMAEDGLTVDYSTARADFGAITYQVADLGGEASKTFTYTVSETNAGRPGYTYDTTIYTVEVTVTDTGLGTLDVSEVYKDAEGNTIERPEFTNTYSAEGEITLKAWKDLAGRDLGEGEFTFELLDAEGNVLGTSVNNGDGSITFSPDAIEALNFDETDIGETYYFGVREVEGSDSTVNYDISVHGYAVTVFDNGDGTLSFSQGTATPILEVSDCESCGGAGHFGPYEIPNRGWNAMFNSATSRYDKYGDGYGGFLVPYYTRLLSIGELTFPDAGWTPLNPYAIPGVIYYPPSDQMYTFVTRADYTGRDESFESFWNPILTSNSEWDAQELSGPAHFYFVAGTGFAHGGYGGYITIGCEPTCPECGGTGETFAIIGWTTEEAEPPVFTNTLKPGGFSVTKTVENPDSADPDQEFTFHVRLIGDEVTDETVTSYTLTQAATPDSGDAAGNGEGGESGTGGNGTGGNAAGYIRPFSIRDLSMSSLHAGGLLALEGLLPMADDSSEVFHATDEQLQGRAYAVITNESDPRGANHMIFFRSTATYSTGADKTVTDIKGNTYTGYVFNDVEYLNYRYNDDQTYNTIPWGVRGTYSDLAAQVVSVEVAEGQAIRPYNNMRRWFQGFTNLTSFDATGFDTSRVTSFYMMFWSSTSIGSLDLSSWDTSSATTMYSMFAYCSSLTSVDVSNFNTSNVIGMTSMFSGCSSLQTVDVSNFDTSKVRAMNEMFRGCKSLSSIDVSGFNTPSLVSLMYMFQNCSSLTDIDVSSFTTQNVHSFRYMFAGCSGLTELDLSNFETTSATNMNNMFEGCTGLTELDLSNFETPLLKDAGKMFSGCTNLESLDIRNLDTTNVVNRANGGFPQDGMGGMFTSCSKLKSVTLGDNFRFKGNNLSSASNWAILPTPSGEGYTGDWICRENGEGPYTAVYLRNNYTSAMAGTWVWETDSPVYTVQFQPGDEAGGSMQPATFIAGADATLPANGFFRFGYTFDHWKVSSVNGQAPAEEMTFADEATIPAGTYNKDDSIVLTAVFVPLDTSVEMHDGEFTFTLHGGETATFDDIPAGTAYQVWEETPEGWVLVSQENVSGEIVPLETAEARFTNRYQPGTAQVQFNGTKTLDGRAADADAFSFELGAVTEGAPMPEVTTISTLAGGFVQFDAITYTLDDLEGEGPWTFEYTIREVAPENDAIDYDTHEEAVTVTVEKTGENKIKATVEYGSGAAAFSFENHTRPGMLAITKDAETTEASADDVFTFKVTFTNDKGIPIDESIAWYVQNADGSTVVPEAPQAGGRIRTPHILANRIPLLSGLLLKAERKEPDSSNYFYATEEQLQGTAYAFISDDGEMVFFRSDVEYEDGQTYDNVMFEGTAHSGKVYSIYEDSGRRPSWIPNTTGGNLPRAQISSVRVAEGQAIRPKKMYQWFMWSELSEFDPTGIDTSMCTDMSSTFSGCPNLTSLDISSFDTSKVTSMSGTFSGCSGLTSLDLSSLDTRSATTMYGMFERCSGLTSLDVSTFDTSKVTNMQEMFFYCSGLTELDLSTFNTSRVTNMSQMFWMCTGLTSIDLSGFDTRNVTTMYYMFDGCESLRQLDLSMFQTPWLTNMRSMFQDCKSLESVDVSSLNTSRIADMYGIFMNCESLKSLDLSNWNTSSATTMMNMFYGCRSLTELDLTSFDTRKVTSFYNTFGGCHRLRDIDLSSFSGASATEIKYMFQNCFALKTLDLSNFATPNATDMIYMFTGCSNLELLDISSLDCRKASDLTGMFRNCNALKVVTLGPNFRFKPTSGSTSKAALLPTPSGSGYSGNWINEGLGNSYSASGLRDNYTSSLAGVWVWELGNDFGGVIFDAQEGTYLGNIITASPGTMVIMPTDSNTKYRHHVLNPENAWNTSPDGSGAGYAPGEQVDDIIVAGAYTTLYAQWDEVTWRDYTVRHYQQPVSLSTNHADYVLADTDILQEDFGTQVTPETKDYDGFIIPATQTVTVAEDDSTVVSYYYDRVQYDIHYDGNGAGNGAMADQYMMGAVPVNLSRNKFVKSGSLFLGWNTEPDGSGDAYLDGQEVVNLTDESGSTITLYAQWLENPNSELEPTRGEIIVQCKAGQTIVIPDLPAGTRYTIEEIGLPDGWTQTGSVNTEGAIVPNTISEASVSNTYSSEGETMIVAHKRFIGGDLQEGQFTFKLEVQADNGYEWIPVEGGTVTNGAVDTQPTVMDAEGNLIDNPWAGSASVEFGPLEFTLDDAGNTYIFRITEVAGDDADIIWDTHAERVTVTVSDAGHGMLDIDVQYDDDGAEFVNRVAVDEGTLEITKTLEGAESSDAEFNFTINLYDADGNPLSGSFEARHHDGVKREASQIVHSYNVDDKGKMLEEYMVFTPEVDGAIVSFPGAESLHVEAKYTFLTWYPSAFFMIVNGAVPEVETGTVSLPIELPYQSYPGSDRLPDELTTISQDFAGDTLTFIYSVMPFYPGAHDLVNYGFFATVTGDVYYETTSVSSGDTVTLKGGERFEILGLPAGATYTVTEVPADGWTQVSAEGDEGTIAADETATAAFVNSYDALGALELKAEKTYEGGTLAANQFQFELLDEDGEQIEVVGNKADGTVAFSPIAYELEDVGTEFTYTVRELIPGDDADEPYDGVTYDGTVYTVTVTPEDDGNGGIVAEPVIEKDGTEVESMMFENSYEGEGEIPLTATKILEGREFKSGDTWTFTVAGVDGAPVRTEKGGEVAESASASIEPTEGTEHGFDLCTLYFENDDLGGAQVKDFTYTVAESGTVKYVENDEDAERTITVRVTDNGNGVLSVKLLDGSDELAWTNTYTNPDLISIPVEKAWKDSDDAEGIRPASVTVRLLADGKDTGESLVLSEENGWKGAFEELEEGPAYTVSEDPVEGYSTAIAGDASKGFTVTNTHEIVIPETVDVSGSKTWDDADDRDGVRPESITVRLLADGAEVDSATVTAEDGWAWSFDGLPKFNDGSEIAYTVTEDAVDGYSTTYSGYDVTNSRTPDETSVTVVKVWDDEGDKDGVRPASVTVRLLADGKDTGETLVLSEANGWRGSFAGLPVNGAGGERISYTVAEDPVEGYSTAIAGDAEKGFTVANTHSPEEETPPPPTPKPKPEIPDTGDAALAAWPLVLAGAAALLAARRLRRRED